MTFRLNSTSISKHDFAVVLAWLTPALIYYTFLAKHHWINVPSGDDFMAILDWMAAWKESSGLSEKISLILQQHFSHRISFTRIATLLSTGTSGLISFIFIQLTGWTCWLIFTWLFVKKTPRLSNSIWLTLAVSLILFNPIGSSNFITSMQGPQNLGVHLLAFVAFLSSTGKSPLRTILALATGAAVILTSANGIAVLPLITFYYGFNNRWKECATALIVFCVTLIIFFYGYERSPTEWLIGSLMNQFFVMLGSPFCLLRMPYEVAFWAGIPTALASAFLLLNIKLLKEKPLAWMFLSFLLGSCLMAALGRMGWPDDYMIQDRYRIYGLLILIMIACLMPLPNFRIRRVSYIAALSLALAFSILGYLTNSAPVITAGFWKESTAINAQLGYHFPYIDEKSWPNAQRALEHSINNHIYQPPKRLSSLPTDLTFAENPKTPINQKWHTDRSNAGAGYWLIPESTIRPRPLATFLILPDGKIVHLPQVIRREPIKTFLTSGTLIADRYHLMLPLHLEWEGLSHITEVDITTQETFRIRSHGMLANP